MLIFLLLKPSSSWHNPFVDSARRMLQGVRIVFIAVIVLYFFMINRFPSHTIPNPIMLTALTALAFADVGALFIIRQILVIRPEQKLLVNSADTIALAKWKTGHIAMYAVSLSIAIYGLVLHFLGFATRQVVPFFGAAVLLLLLLPPRSLDAQARL